MKSDFTRYTAALVAATTLVATSVAISQSGTSPSGTPVKEVQPPGSSSNPSGMQHAEARMPKVIALTFYADWCPGCKMLTPKLEAAKKKVSEQPCLFVKLDQTDKDSVQAEYLLSALGVSELWKDNAGKTGFVILLDAKTKKVIGKITADQTSAAMAAAISSAVQG